LHQGNGGICQFISGLQIGREHWLQFRYNKRQGGLMGLRTVFAGVEIDHIPSISVAGASPYHFRQVPFTPAVDSGDLDRPSVTSSLASNIKSSTPTTSPRRALADRCGCRWWAALAG
jgi:hypothetical protein